MKHQLKRWVAWLATGSALAVVGCASTSSSDRYDGVATAMIKASFQAQGQASLDRLVQDPLQKACSGATPPPAEVARQLETHEMSTIRPPANGRYLGDWHAGEKLAQNGAGMTWSDPAGAANGGNCYNCHQLSPSEISFGTLGPSLHNYGKLRGVTDPSSAAAQPIVRYTWGKLFNAKANNACSTMPRFGAAHVLSEQQLQDIMALLLDPKSPVNQ